MENYLLCGAQTGIETCDLSVIVTYKKARCLYRFHSSLASVRMTIRILFYAKEKLVVRLNMCLSSLGDKLLDEVTDEELERNGFPFYADVKIVTNQAFVEKVWYACVKQGYISTDFDLLGRFVDTLHIVM